MYLYIYWNVYQADANVCVYVYCVGPQGGEDP